MANETTTQPRILTAPRRPQRGNRGTVNTGERLENHRCGRERCPRIPGTDHGLRFLTAYQFYGDTNRGKSLFAERHPRRFFHVNHFCGVTNGDRQVVRL